MFRNNILRTLPLVLAAAWSVSAEELVWQQLTAEAPWTPRYAHSVVEHRGDIYLLGGALNGPRANDIWVSKDGIEWKELLPEAPWATRAAFGCFSWHNELYIVGGEMAFFLLDDLWHSKDGLKWEQLYESRVLRDIAPDSTTDLPAGPFLPRIWSATTLFGDKIVVTGGGRQDDMLGPIENANDVWSSSDAEHWTQETANAAWLPRFGHSLTEFDSQLYLLAGESLNGYSNEVWRTNNLRDWILACRAPWDKRISHLSVATDEAIFVLGRYNRDSLADVWMSRDGGHWEQVGFLPEKVGRHGLAGFVRDNRLYIFGGNKNGENSSDVWVADLASVLTVKTDPKE
jgi:hypothetical protein